MATPARRSASVTSNPHNEPVVSTTKQSSAVDGAPNTPSASQAIRVRSTPMAKPMPGVGGPPSASTRPS